MFHKQLNIVIVEDMAITRASLEDKLLDHSFNVIGSYAKAEVAWNHIQLFEHVDLILLDINLAGEKDGIWLAQQIRATRDIPIIFLSAFGDDTTLKEVVATEPNGYLMKPYKLPTLLTTIKIAIDNFQKQTGGKSIFIKDGYEKIKLIINDVLFIKSDGNYLHIHLEDKRYTVREKLSEFIKSLDVNFVLRCHLRYAINMNKVDSISTNSILLDGVQIPVSSKYKSNLTAYTKGR